MDVKVKSNINARDLHVWAILDEDTETCGASVAFGERLKSITDRPQTSIQSAANDGVVVETYSGMGVGGLELGLSNLIPSEETLLLRGCFDVCKILWHSGQHKNTFLYVQCEPKNDGKPLCGRFPVWYM